MAGSSEEYLAALGFDTSDAEKTLQRLITITGHVGNQFDSLSRQTGAAERALTKTGKGGKDAAAGIDKVGQSAKESTYELKGLAQGLSQVWANGVKGNQAQMYAGYLSAQKAAADEQRKATQQGAIYQKYLDDENKAVGKLTASQQQLQRSQQNLEYDRLARELGPLAAATRRLMDAQENQARAQRAVAAAAGGNIPAQVAANKQLAAATAQVQAAQRAQAVAQRQADTAAAGHTANLARLRYALFDVSRAFTFAGIALTAFSVIAYKTAIDYQRDFANVARTTQVTGEAADKLRSQLLAISQTNPISFKDVTTIAALAGQLGVATAGVAKFSEVTAQFAATTNVSVTDSATAFARLDALLPDVQGNYRKLSDSILNVGVNSIAAEGQIIAITNRIAGIGSTVGLTSDQVIGLAGALASLGIQPELAQGTITRLFTKIQVAASQGGESLEYFAKISGKSADQFASDWSKAPSQTLISVLDGINAGGPQAISILQNLGLTGSRDIPTLLKLAQNTDELAKSFSLAADSAGTTADQYGIVAETVAAKLQVLTNNFQALFAALGSGSTLIGPILDGFNSLLRTWTAMASTPIGGIITSVVVALAGIAGLSALAAGATLRFAGTLAAVRTAMAEENIQGNILTGTMTLLRTSIQGVTAANAGVAGGAATASAALGAQAGATGAAAASTFGLRDALLALGRATVVFAAIQYGASLIFNFNQTAKDSIGFLAALGFAIRDTFVSAAQTVTQFIGAIPGAGIFAEWSKGLSDYQAKLAATDAETYAMIDAQFKVTDATSGATDAQAAFNAALDGTTDGIYGQTDALSESVGAILDASSAASNIESSLYSLGDGLGYAGDNFSYFSEAGRTNLANLAAVIKAYTDDAAGNADVLAGNLRGLFQSVVAGGYASAGALALLSNAIAATGSSAKAVPVNIASLMNGFSVGTGRAAKEADKLAKSAGSAAKEVRTLVDYANDLKGVFSRAFDLRFGGMEALDTISGSWNSIKKAIADTNQQIREYRDDMRSLTADKATREYWLKVAENYGDTLRAGELRAEIGAIDTKLSKTSKDLTAAQQKNSKTLVGNTDAAIDNRSEILGLVKNYEDYIQVLAASGLPQDELARRTAALKQQFIQQATQLGYSREQIGKYAKSFDDVAIAIQKVPRNITVTANTNPALQALNEFVAKVRSTKAGVNVGGIGAGGGYDAGKQYGNAFKQGLDQALSKAHVKIIPGGNLRFDTNGKMVEGNVGNLRFFRSGTDWTGSGPAGGIAGIVHNRERVLNEQGSRMVSSQFVNAANQGRNPWQYAPQTKAAKFPSSMTVELSPIDREILASGKAVTVVLSSDDLAYSTTASNAEDNRRGGA